MAVRRVRCWTAFFNPFLHADVSRYAGHYEHVFESTTAGVTIQAPQLDINTVAAGGGSRLFFRSGVFQVSGCRSLPAAQVGLVQGPTNRQCQAGGACSGVHCLGTDRSPSTDSADCVYCREGGPLLVCH